MIVLAGVAIVALVVVGMVAALGVAAIGSESRSSGSSLGVAAVVAGGLLAVLVVLGLGVAILGLGRGAQGADESPATSVPVRAPTTTEVAAPLERAIEGAGASYDGFVELDRMGTELLVPRVVRGFVDGDVIEVSGRGFVAQSPGVLAQCDGTAARRCSNVVDIQTDVEGAFRVAYRVADDAGDALVVDVDGDRRTAVLDFGSARPWPVSKVEGDVLVVTGAPVTGLTLARCPRDAIDLDPCTTVDRVSGGPGSTARFGLTRIGGRSAADDVVVLLDGAGTVLAAPLGLRADEAVEVSTSPLRLSLGLGLALVLLAAAVQLVRRTDWRAPAEASAVFLDDEA